MVCTGPLNLGGKPTDASMILVSKPYKEMANSTRLKFGHRFGFKIFFATIFGLIKSLSLSPGTIFFLKNVFILGA